jgi:hypothetical protein
MKLNCTNCEAFIPQENVNVSEGVAVCPECAEAFHLSELLGDEDMPPKVEMPPNTKVPFMRDGVRRMGLIIKPKLFSGITIFMTIFALFWNSISWTIFIDALGNGDTGAILFLTIFVSIGAITALSALFCIFGKTSLAMNRDNLTVMRTLFFLNYKRTYNMVDITDVTRLEAYQQNSNSVYGVGIKIGKKKVVFGSHLSDDEQAWLIWELYDFWKAVT